jgi:RNA polymerase sigma-32 factor
LQPYLAEISQYSRLTREQEREYGIRVKESQDQEAAALLVRSNLRLVVKIALGYQAAWMQNLLDLIQEGNIGLMQAAKKFDPYKNVKFSYYASFWIKAHIVKFIMDNWRLVKIGTTPVERRLFYGLKREKQALVAMGFHPTLQVLSTRLQVSEQAILDMDQRLDGWDVSLDAPARNDSDTYRMDFIEGSEETVEEAVSRKQLHAIFQSMLGSFREPLTPRETHILERRLLAEMPVTLEEIGDRYLISRERARQVEARLIAKLRAFLKRVMPDFPVEERTYLDRIEA